MKRRKTTRISRERFHEVVLDLEAKKDTIRQRIAKGAPLVELCDEYGLCDYTMLQALKTAGIERPAPRAKQPPAPIVAPAAGYGGDDLRERVENLRLEIIGLTKMMRRLVQELGGDWATFQCLTPRKLLPASNGQPPLPFSTP